MATSKKTSILTNTENTSTELSVQTARKRLTPLNEFAVVNNLRPEIKAGFKYWLKGKYYHFDEEWKELFKIYNER